MDNHDLPGRFHNKQYPNQTKLALACLMTMQGIPCIYYGTEQGLDGQGKDREYSREALWGITNAFSEDHELYKYLQDLSKLHSTQPALRYGRQYFRACSGNGIDYGYSPYKGGIIAFSRILNDREVLVVANTNIQDAIPVHVVVDKNINPEGKEWTILFPFEKQSSSPLISKSSGIYRTIEVTVSSMEVLVLG